MFCPNCGTEMGENVQFCPTCGAKTGTITGANTSTSQTTLPPLSAFTSWPSSLKFTIFALGTLLLGLILSLTPTIKASYGGYSTSVDMYTAGEMDSGTIISFILYLPGMALLALPFISKSQWKLWNLVPCMVGAGLMTLLYLMVYIYVNDQAYGIDISMTFTGLLMQAANIATVVLAIKAKCARNVPSK